MIRKTFSRLFQGRERHYGHSAKDIRFLGTQVDQTKLPLHVAIIMDGNGRWASRRGLPRLSGHVAGSNKAEEIVKFAQVFKNLFVGIEMRPGTVDDSFRAKCYVAIAVI